MEIWNEKNNGLPRAEEKFQPRQLQQARKSREKEGGNLRVAKVKFELLARLLTSVEVLYRVLGQMYNSPGRIFAARCQGSSPITRMTTISTTSALLAALVAVGLITVTPFHLSYGNVEQLLTRIVDTITTDRKSATELAGNLSWW